MASTPSHKSAAEEGYLPKLVSCREAAFRDRLARSSDFEPLMPFDSPWSLDADPYLSPAYLKLTGRRGAFQYVPAASRVVAMLHPNQQDQVLLMADWCGITAEDLVDAIEQVAEEGLTVSLARVPDASSSLIDRVSERYVLARTEEPVLDWRFPVHVLDAQKVVEAKGGAFQRMRQALNRTKEKTQLLECDMSRPSHRASIRKIAEKWCAGFDSASAEAQALGSPRSYFEALFEIASRNAIGIQMVCLKLDGHPVGFAAVERRPIANLLASQVLPVGPYLSECLYWHTACWCRDNGLPALCLGGSETAGLDRFKRKFAPVSSVSLQTFNVLTRQ